MKDLQQKGLYEFIIMKNCIHKFMRLNTKTWEESRYNNPNPPKPELPTGCEYKSRRAICVKKIENKDDYLDLLLDADPSKASINKYLDLQKTGNVIAVNIKE